MGAGTRWDSKASLFACRAYVRASENPLKGVGQKKKCFEEDVFREFKLLVEEAVAAGDKKAARYLERQASAVRQRYVKVRGACISFSRCLKMIKAAEPTGSPSEDDMWNAALAIYNEAGGVKDMYSFFGLHGTARGDAGDPFPYTLEFKFLVQTNQWKLAEGTSPSKKPPASLTASGADAGTGQENSSNEDSEEDVPVSADGAAEEVAKSRPSAKRPLGKKKAQERMDMTRAISRGAKGIESLAEASTKRTKLSTELLSIEKMKARMQLFSMPGGSAANREKFLEMMQAEALREMERSEAREKLTETATAATNAQNADTARVLSFGVGAAPSAAVAAAADASPEQEKTNDSPDSGSEPQKGSSTESSPVPSQEAGP